MALSDQDAERQAAMLAHMLRVPMSDARMAMEIARHASSEAESALSRVILTSPRGMAKVVTMAACSITMMDMHKLLVDILGDQVADMVLEACAGRGEFRT